MNIDDLREDIKDLKNGHYDNIANALEELAYAWENPKEKDLEKTLSHFLLDFVDYPIPNFINSDVNWKKVQDYSKEKR